MKPTPKTFEEHVDYLYQTTRLMLFFTWHWLPVHPEEKFKDVLDNRIDIFRKTCFNPGRHDAPVLRDDPGWCALARQAEERYSKAGSAEEFEEKGFLIFKDAIDKRARSDFKLRPYVLDYKCGSLNWDPPREIQGREVICFHIANAVQPRSIFDDPLHLAKCLKDLMDQTEEQYNATRLSTGTWLNSHPRFLEYFPQAYMDNRSEPNKNVQWHYGFWGQFISARGTYNYKLGRKMRETGDFPYANRGSWCTFAELRKHLKANFSI